MRSLLGSFVGVSVSLGLSCPGAAQKIESMNWGFDGTSVAPGFFNPLTVVVRNDSAAPIDDTLLLVESNGMRDVGTPLMERCYLTPGAQRVVQFHPYITTCDGRWLLRWRRAVARIDVQPQPQPGWRGLALLRAGDGPPDRQHRLSAFPAAWFPATPGAAEALAEAVLDSVPEWDEGRANAFLAWLRGGGRLHLLAKDRRPLQFGGVLSVLDDPRQRFTVGAGTVLRYATSLDDTTAKQLQRTAVRDPEVPVPREARAADVLGGLQLSLLPHHPWGLIFLAAFTFLGCVGPVHWILARRRIDWRLSIGYLLVVVALFTLLFGWLGARGYDEVSRLRTLAYARVCGDGEVVATQYTNAFVTSGGERRFQPRAAASVLSTAQTFEAVAGIVDSGAGGSLRVDMPMFSARGFVHRGHYRLENLPKIVATDARTFTVEGATPLGGYLLDNRRLWRTTVSGGMVQRAQMIDSQSEQMRGGQREQVFGANFLMQRALDVVCERLQLATPDQVYPDADASRVFILFESPPELHVDTSPNVGQEESYVIYDFDLR